MGGAWAFGHYTHEKNPVTARAALETIRIIEDENLVENAARVGAQALARLRSWTSRFPAVGDVRGRGFLIGIELQDIEGPSPKLVAERTLYNALERGLSFKITMGTVLTLTPPLITTQEDMDQALDVLEEAIEQALSL